MCTRFLSLVVTGAALSACAMSHAAVLPAITGITSDAAGHDNDTWNGLGDDVRDMEKDNLRVGRWGGGDYRNAVFVFQLPALGGGETVESAQFNVGYWEVKGAGPAPTFGVDAGVLRVNASPNVQSSDYSGGTLLQSNFVTTLTTESFGGYTGLNSTGQNTLGTYLASNYLAGSYVFISLKANAAVTVDHGYHFFTADMASAGDFKPQLVLTTVIPEPASLSLLALGAMGLMRRKRAR